MSRDGRRCIVADLWVRPLPDEERAEAWIEVWNTDRRNKPASLEISVFGQNFRDTVISRLRYTPGTRIIPGVGDLQKPTDNQDVTLTMGPGLNLLKVPLAIPKVRRWDLHTPWLYQIQVRLLDDAGRVVDQAKRQFGMRTMRQDVDSIPRGRLFLNDRQIRLRGANTMGFEQQDVFQKDFPQLVDDILLAKICNMNYLRLTQRPVQPEVYEYCDRLGLMLQTDLPLFGCMRYNKVRGGRPSGGGDGTARPRPSLQHHDQLHQRTVPQCERQAPASSDPSRPRGILRRRRPGRAGTESGSHYQTRGRRLRSPG